MHTDGQGRWELLAARPGGTVTALVTSGNAVLATTPCGVRRSTDSGRSWSVVGGGPPAALELAVPSPAFATDQTLLAGTADGLVRSTDGGLAWQPVLVGSRVLTIAFSPAFREDSQVLIGTEQDGILRSTDGGRTWTSANPGLLDLTVLSLALSPAFDVDHTAFAATASGLFRSTASGRAWRALETVPGEPAVQCLAVSPGYTADPVVLAGTEADGLLRSVDAGATWHSVAAGAGRSVTALAWSAPDRVAAATDTGVLVSEDSGATWRSVGSEHQPVLCVTFAPDGALLAGLPRRGILRSPDGSNWEDSNAGLQANLLVALTLARDHTLYAAGLEDGVIISTDLGATWMPANDGLEDEPAVFGLAFGALGTYAATSTGLYRRLSQTAVWERMQSVAVRTVRAGGPRVAAVGMDGAVFASDDGGATWQVPAWPGDAGQPLSVVLAEPSTLLVGCNMPSTSEVAIWQTRDTLTWRRILVEPGSGVAQIATSPTYAVDQQVFVGAGRHVLGTVRDMAEVVHRERRPVWRRTSLPGTVSALETSPAYARDRTVVAATSAGVHLSTDAGATFVSLATAPTVAAAFSREYAEDHHVYAVELGGRIWRHQTSM